MLSEEEKEVIEYYSNREVSFSVDFDTEKLLKALGIIEEDSFEKHQIRFKTLLNLITRLEKENESLNKIGETYKLALFMIIRNSTVMPKGIKLGKNDKEINEMSYETLCEVLAMVDYNIAKKLFKEGETTFENNIGKENENE